MSMPRFTAHASLYKSSHSYVMAGAHTQAEAGVQPAQFSLFFGGGINPCEGYATCYRFCQYIPSDSGRAACLNRCDRDFPNCPYPYD